MSESKTIPEKRKIKLDELFQAFSVIAEDTYAYLCDMKYDYSRWSKGLVDNFGLPSEYMYAAGDIWEEHIHPEDKKTYSEGIADIFAGRSDGHDMQYRARKTNGEYDVCTCRGVVIRDGDGEPEYFAGSIRNHGNQSHVDALTGLRNQYGFFEDLQGHIKNRIPARIAMVGIGKFTQLNEIYGYHFGNMILQRFGRYLMDEVGNRGGTYRLDGTKFAVITETQTAEEIKKSYDGLRDYFRTGISIEDARVVLELNAGILSLDHFNIDDQTVYTCLNFAYDESKQKKQGDPVEFRNELTGDNRKRLETLYAIRSSISKMFNGFFLLYQPIVDAAAEEMIGAEALLRWKNEEYGVVPPDLFIPVIESDPLFPVLGEWILIQALEDAKKAMAACPQFVINVNLSYSQLERADFADMVFQALKTTGFPAEHLCLEITERCRLLDMDMLKNIVVRLRVGGIRIALDDFGTGFSSMSLVKNLPFDTIKIDRSFIQKIEEDEKERKIVNHFTDMASTFGAKVCVEGIETEGMRDILRGYKIRSFQGYFYSRPVAIEELIKWSS